MASKPKDGDGPWCEALQPPATLHAAVADYLWAGLGSPVGRERWEFTHAVRGLGSGLIDQSQKMIVAAMAMAEKKVWAQRSYRVWMRRQSLSFPNMFSMRCRRR